MAAEYIASTPVEVADDTDLILSDNKLINPEEDSNVEIVYKSTMDQTVTDVDLKEEDVAELGRLPDPDPLLWSGYIFKQSRHIKQLRLRHVVVSLKHSTLSTFTDDSKESVTEQIPLKHYTMDKLTDSVILAELRGEIKAWDEFVLVPTVEAVDANRPTFYFCSSWGTEDPAENGRFVKAAVICAMSYKLAANAVRAKNYLLAKDDLCLFARHLFRLEETRGKPLKQRLEAFEKWMGIAVKLPFNPKSKMAVKTQCKLLRCHAYYMMNTFGDKWLGLQTVYEQILELEPDCEITMTYYGQWLVEGAHGIKKGLELLKRASGTIVQLWDFEDENIKNKRFKEPLQAQLIMEQYIAQRLNKGMNVGQH